MNEQRALTGDGEDRADFFLRRNAALYERLLRQMLRRGGRNAEASLWCLQALAEFCVFHHTGQFADGRLENVGLDIGTRLEKLVHSRRAEPAPQPPRDGRRRVLHVATSVHTVGGHTRTIKNWVTEDRTSRHSLFLTRQEGEPVPARLVEVVRAQGGETVVLPAKAPLLDRAWRLRAFARAADLVVLHHFGDDVVPTVAFAVADCPPVAVLNHADHLFWLGGSVADAVINQRAIGQRLSEERRSIPRNTVLPIPLLDAPQTLCREAARERLGIPEGRTVLVSVGRATKYVPTQAHDFPRTAAEILEANAEAHVYLVGVSENDRRVHRGLPWHPRLHLVGPVEDASFYHAAADVYLEGFPFGSQTALLEAALAGVPTVRAYAPPLELLATSDEALEGLVSAPTSERDYVERASALIRDPQHRRRLGLELKQNALDSHCGEGWRRRLRHVYDEVCRPQHFPRPLAALACSATETDTALSAWQATNVERANPRFDPSAEARDVWLTSAYGARQTGDYAGAFHLLCRCLCLWGCNRRVLAALGKLWPHWAWRHLRPTLSAHQP